MWRVSRWWRCSSSLTRYTAGAASPHNLLDVLCSPASSHTALVTASNALLPHLIHGEVSLTDQVRIMQRLHASAVRHEGVLQKCFWNVFKASPPAAGDTTALQLLAQSTAVTLRIMTDLKFVNDPQLVTLALGRCTELATQLSLCDVSEVYAGLAGLAREHFSLTEVALHESELADSRSLRDPRLSPARHTAAELVHQPNLIDVLCSELEWRLRCLVLGDSADVNATAAVVPAMPTCQHRLVIAKAAASGATPDHTYLTLLHGLSVVGVQGPSPLLCMQVLTSQQPRSTLPLESLVWAMQYALHIRERAVDALDHDESPDTATARVALLRCLAHNLLERRNIQPQLQRSPQLVLCLRRLFETYTELSLHAPKLWDTVRTIRVAHRHVTSAMHCLHNHSARTNSKGGVLRGRLFEGRYAVKPRTVISRDDAAERFIPPQFKTWRSPQVTVRGGHTRRGGSPRVQAFGTRRIAPNYISKLRKKYVP